VDEARKRGWSDEEQLAFTLAAGRVIFTKNAANFRRLDQCLRVTASLEVTTAPEAPGRR